jgi:hypothetical protein
LLGICYGWAVNLGLGLEPFAGIEVYKRKRARAETTSKNLNKLLFFFPTASLMYMLL